MSAGAYIGIGLVIGGGLGLLIGWLIGRSRAPIAPADSRLENDLQQRLAQREAEQRTLQEQLLALNQRNGELGAELKSLNERLTTERQQLETIQERFRKEFEAVSNKLILDNASRFNQQSTESLGKLLTPLKETLGEFKTSLDTTRRETATHSALLKEQISRIGNEAANLSKALKGDVKVLGNWGENMLDQILEKSGLQKDIHYRRQRSAKDAEGDQRFLDVIVELPDKRNLVIDSKVSLRAYEESVNAADDPAKLAGLDRHVEALRKHFRDLGAKRYQDIHGINTPDFSQPSRASRDCSLKRGITMLCSSPTRLCWPPFAPSRTSGGWPTSKNTSSKSPTVAANFTTSSSASWKTCNPWAIRSAKHAKHGKTRRSNFTPAQEI
jgi:DNA recombination protein RmuC